MLTKLSKSKFSYFQIAQILFLFFSIGLAANVNATASPLRVRLSSDPTTLDWNLAWTPAETTVLMNIMEGLVAFDEDMHIQPALAKRWSISKDGRRYSFVLRSDVKWSNGQPLRADDFVRSWKRLLDPKTGATYAYLLFGIEGAKDFNSGKITDFSKVGIIAKGPNTIEVTLKQPIPYFLQLMTFWVTFPIQGTTAEQSTVLGAYQVAEFRPGQRIVLVRNDRYYGKRPKIERIELPIIEDDSTAVKLFESGKLDFTRPVAQLDLSRFKNSKNLKIDAYDRTCFISFNTRNGPFTDIRARQSVRNAINVDDLSTVSDGIHKPARSLVSAEVMRLQTPVTKTPDTSILRGKSATFVTFSNDENITLSTRLQTQLVKSIGLNIKIRSLDYKSYQSAMKAADGDIFFRCWGADYVDPDSYFSIFSSSANSGRMTWTNQEYDQLVDAAATETNTKQRKTLYQRAQRILIDDSAAIVPIYYDSLTYLLAPNVKNFKINPLNYIYFKNVEN